VTVDPLVRWLEDGLSLWLHGVHDGVGVGWLQLIAGFGGWSGNNGEEKSRAAAELLRK
jgi:hypothetical protein